MGPSLAKFVCALVASFCALSGRPDLNALQAAYDREITSGSALHDKDLRLLEAKCEDRDPDGRYLCQVTFTSSTDPAHRLYFDVISVLAKADRLQLESGLCKR